MLLCNGRGYNRLQTGSHIHIGCIQKGFGFGTLVCWVWAYGATLTVIRLCRSGVDFGIMGVDLSPCNVVM